MIVILKPHADLSAVKAALQGLGLWVRPFTGEAGGSRALLIEPCSRKVSPESIGQIAGVAEVFAEASPHPKLDQFAGRSVELGGGEGVVIGERRVGTESVVAGAAASPVLMAGPCSVESEAQIHAAAELAARCGARMLRGGAFKPRTSPYSFAGNGSQALRWLREAADAHGLGVVTEVMSEAAVDEVAEVADLVQLGSRNMQNFALLHAAGRSGKPVLLKRGMAADLHEWRMAAEHALNAGASAVIFCERGIRHFDGHTRNLLDLAAVATLKHVYRLPVIVDPSHALGRRDLVVPMAAAALAAGADGLLIEAHPTPQQAQSDGAQALSAAELEQLAQAIFAERRENVL